MNGKQMACIVLLMIIGAVTYGAQIVHKKAAVAIQAADDEAASAELAANDANMAKITLEKAKSDAQDLERFLVAWTPVIQRLSSRQEVESAVQANTREARVFVVSQKFEDFKKLIGDVLIANFKLIENVEFDWKEIIDTITIPTDDELTDWIRQQKNKFRENESKNLPKLI